MTIGSCCACTWKADEGTASLGDDSWLVYMHSFYVCMHSPGIEELHDVMCVCVRLRCIIRERLDVGFWRSSTDDGTHPPSSRWST